MFQKSRSTIDRSADPTLLGKIRYFWRMVHDRALIHFDIVYRDTECAYPSDPRIVKICCLGDQLVNLSVGPSHQAVTLKFLRDFLKKDTRVQRLGKHLKSYESATCPTVDLVHAHCE